jgi:hypothetical protein
METFMDPDEAARADFEAADRAASIACLNLLRFRAQALYLPLDAEHGSAAAEVSAREACGRCSEVALQQIVLDGAGLGA